MKNKLQLFLCSALAVLCLACDPDKGSVAPTSDDNSGPPSAPATGAVTPVGTPEGTPLTATIGPAGGSIQSADQRIRISIPAGALTETKTISVQPLTNQCPSGTGQAFRLTPHGLTFAKPATLTFQYDEQDVKGSAPEFLRVAYQNEKGSWQSPSLKSIDTTAHNVTISTTHFSDWSLFQNVKLTHDQPGSIILDPGGQVNLKVWGHIDTPSDNTDDLIIPIPVLLDEKYIDSWQVAAEGSLKNTKSSNINTYQAPNHIPARNPVAVSVLLNKTVTIDGRVYRDLRLVSNVFVAPEGISVQIDGGAWQTYPGGANLNSTQNVVTGKNGAESASVSWKGAPEGVFRWTKSTDVAFNLLQGPMIYQHLYGTKNVQVSGGSLKVDNSNLAWVVGTFTVQPAGWVRPSTPPNVIGTANIKGVFRMKRIGQQ
ncbi:hypothetical protein [Salmonirosea aquatica]|uniref:ZU5 domain-containing protein n=1 Tax=Salmonirosea aquatica TaxID=2654236 RepID=A0A7C9BE69_9BACT|nr:hypothetical protein [Cytophagaceae bacterium SJW1-29]